MAEHTAIGKFEFSDPRPPVVGIVLQGDAVIAPGERNNQIPAIGAKTDHQIARRNPGAELQNVG